MKPVIMPDSVELPKTGMVSIKQLAAATRVSEGAWRKWYREGYFPGAVKVGPPLKAGGRDIRSIRIPVAEASAFISPALPQYD